ncbi:MAG: IS1634 family transposase, partial [Chitinophagaceae bacterium]
VLAMVVNVEGFIKYTAIHEGNLTDCKTLAAMIEKLSAHTCNPKAIIGLDAGIATEENLAMIKNKGYHYVCVSRTKLKDYKPFDGRLNVLLETKSGQDVLLKAVHIEKQSVEPDSKKPVMQYDPHTDYYLEVTSPAKAKKEQGIKNRFKQRFEEELQKIHQAIHRKGGIKKAEKVYQRLGKAKQKYPSVQAYYSIEILVDKKKNQATDIRWEKDKVKEAERQNQPGVYFLRTDLNMADEVVLWNIYNTIREIESSFRCLKTDLDLRPIYHQKDVSAMAHLHLGILAYWIVNAMRHQFKAKGINHQWKEIVRIGNTQKVITTTGQNTFDKIISVRRCSEPAKPLKLLLDILKAKSQPFRKLKSVVHKPALKKIEMPYLRYLPPG